MTRETTRLGLAAPLLVYALAFAPGATAGASEGAGGSTLTVKVAGLRSNHGQVVLALFDSPESYAERRQPKRSARLAPEDGSCEWVVTALESGTYALAVYHDRNGNGELDRRALGMPKEPFGFSNNPATPFGPPSFERAGFVVDGPEQLIEVRLK